MRFFCAVEMLCEGWQGVKYRAIWTSDNSIFNINNIIEFTLMHSQFELIKSIFLIKISPTDDDSISSEKRESPIPSPPPAKVPHSDRNSSLHHHLHNHRKSFSSPVLQNMVRNCFFRLKHYELLNETTGFDWKTRREFFTTHNCLKGWRPEFRK